MDVMYFLEYSYHRIAKIAPLVLEHYNIPDDKVRLVLGNFYETKCTNESMDFVLLSQALHHAERVDDLLAEVYRILKKNGVVIIIGEHNRGVQYEMVSMLKRLRDRVLGYKDSERLALYRQSGCIYWDKLLGDRHYSRWSYAKMFRKNNFKYKRVSAHRNSFSFILKKQE